MQAESWCRPFEAHVVGDEIGAQLDVACSGSRWSVASSSTLWITVQQSSGMQTDLLPLARPPDHGGRLCTTVAVVKIKGFEPVVATGDFDNDGASRGNRRSYEVPCLMKS